MGRGAGGADEQHEHMGGGQLECRGPHAVRDGDAAQREPSHHVDGRPAASIHVERQRRGDFGHAGEHRARGRRQRIGGSAAARAHPGSRHQDGRGAQRTLPSLLHRERHGHGHLDLVYHQGARLRHEHSNDAVTNDMVRRGQRRAALEACGRAYGWSLRPLGQPPLRWAGPLCDPRGRLLPRGHLDPLRAPPARALRHRGHSSHRLNGPFGDALRCVGGVRRGRRQGRREPPPHWCG
mmetsp:Transcript_75143/g.213717  ORF Transcript_75143/g.213717 Transcript_75143/m.213717 type:complete len:237 (-) Transcript_75143:766-1476(-)